MMNSTLRWTVMTICILGMAVVSPAQVRLLGITGLQGEPNDNTLFEINIEDASTTELFELTFIPDTHAIGFNPDDGLIYHTAGSESWTDDPGRVGGFRDHQYLETVNLDTGELTPIFNANPAPSPDEFPAFGLPAPLPNFIAPGGVRLVADPGERERGENEYHGIRGLTWSDEEHLFYASDEHGIFKLDAEGESTFVGQPAVDSRDLKGIVLYEQADGTQALLAGTKKNANLHTIDPATGLDLDDPNILEIPAGSPFVGEFGGLLAIAQHPENGTLFGVRRTDNDAGDAFDRELIILFPGGETATIGSLGAHFASLAFVFPTDDVPPWPGDVNGDDRTDVADLNIMGINWQATGVTMAEGDLTGDGNVNAADLNILAINWQTARDPGAAAVPEPSSVALLLIGLMSAFAYRRKHGS